MMSATTLGRRTAELHQTLASSNAQAFAPESCTRTTLNALADRMSRHAELSLAFLEHRHSSLNEAARPQADAILSARAERRPRPRSPALPWSRSPRS